MTPEEQKEYNHLRSELNLAQRNAEETRANLISELVKSCNEARLYRGLLWFLLGLAAAAAIAHFLRS